MEESDASWSTARHRCSLEPRNDLHLETVDLTAQLERLCVKEQDAAAAPHPAYVPHALAFKRAFPSGKFWRRRFPRRAPPPADSDERSSRATEVAGVLVRPKEPSSLSVPESLFRADRPSRRPERPRPGGDRTLGKGDRARAKRRQLKRLHRAQLIQRQLQLVEEEQRRLEARGVALERSLRGQQPGACGGGDDDDNGLMQLWFQLVQQKNILVRYESELLVFARELQLEDRQSGLQQELRERMTLDDRLKGERELAKERAILEEMLEVVERRKALVPLLEELRLQGRQQDPKLRAAVLGQAWTWT